MEKIQVVGMRPAWGLPSPSPFCLKLETWLRMEGIPYVPMALTKPPQSSTGKVPYLVRNDGSLLADSNIIIHTLASERGIELDRGATPEQRARTHLVLRTLEESLYFAAVWERWQHPDYWPLTKEAMFGHLPAALRHPLAAVIRRKIRAALYGQGIARLAPASIAAAGAADLAALSALLGDRPYFHGDAPGVADASAYGMLANLLAFPQATALKRAAQSHPNLLAFCQRMKDAYWSDGARASS